jgi:hypothetical protein
MILQVAMALAILNPGVRILFYGNSHTYVNNLPQMVKNLIESDDSGRRCQVRHEVVEFLNDANLTVAAQLMKPGSWDVVVLQGALLSSSHKFVYSQAGGIALARIAMGCGAKTLLFAEWPRRGWDEADWQVQGYQSIARPTGATIADVSHVFDRVRKGFPSVPMWMDDGNHAQPAGTFVAACTLYRWIDGAKHFKPTYRVPQVTDEFASTALRVADEVYEAQASD